LAVGVVSLEDGEHAAALHVFIWLPQMTSLAERTALGVARCEPASLLHRQAMAHLGDQLTFLQE
jgi:hypothetical protein